MPPRRREPWRSGVLSATAGMAPVNGHIYAFDRATGKPMWPVPALVGNHQVYLEGGLDLPVIVLLRIHRSTGLNSAPGVKASVLCLDRLTGRAVWLKELHFASNSDKCEVVGDRERNTVVVATPSQTLRLRFTDDPVPPEPPFQAGLIAKQSRLGRTPAGAIPRDRQCDARR